MRNGLDFGGRADRFVGGHATLGVDKVRSKDGVDQSGLAQTRLAFFVHVSREGRGSLFSDMVGERVDSPTHMTLNWNPRFNSLRSIWEVMLSKPTWLRGKTVAGLVEDELAAAAILKKDA